MGDSVSEAKMTETEAYMWVDYACIEQDDDISNPAGAEAGAVASDTRSMKARGINSLPIFIFLCSSFLCLSHPEYDARAWCRTEKFFGTCFGLRQRRLSEDGKRLTFVAAPSRVSLTSAGGSGGGNKGRERPYLDPRKGLLTCASDLPLIYFLTFVGIMMADVKEKAEAKALAKAAKASSVDDAANHRPTERDAW